MPVELFDPQDKGPIKLYAGDPKTIRLRLQNMDKTASTFAAQIRKRAKDTQIVRSFTVLTTLDGADTLVTCSLSGDSAPGAMDGQTRLPNGIRSAFFDVQEWRQNGAGPTIAFAELEVQEDVTR